MDATEMELLAGLILNVLGRLCLAIPQSTLLQHQLLSTLLPQGHGSARDISHGCWQWGQPCMPLALPPCQRWLLTAQELRSFPRPQHFFAHQRQATSCLQENLGSLWQKFSSKGSLKRGTMYVNSSNQAPCSCSYKLLLLFISNLNRAKAPNLRPVHLLST